MFGDACEYGCTEVVKLLLSLTGDRYINVHAIGENAFEMACANKHKEVVKLLLSLEGDRKINATKINFNKEKRYFVLKIMMKKIYRKRKFLLIRRAAEKYKRIMLREIKCLPKCHIYLNFPGGNDYLKIMSKY